MIEVNYDVNVHKDLIMPTLNNLRNARKCAIKPNFMTA